MIVKLPELDFTPAAVEVNRATIKEARGALRGALKALDGLELANQAMCPHTNTVAVHDPNYAGGGHSHTECKDCGGKLP